MFAAFVIIDGVFLSPQGGGVNFELFFFLGVVMFCIKNNVVADAREEKKDTCMCASTAARRRKRRATTTTTTAAAARGGADARDDAGRGCGWGGRTRGCRGCVVATVVRRALGVDRSRGVDPTTPAPVQIAAAHAD